MYDLVFTVAVKSELPISFLKESNIHIVTLKGLLAGVLNDLSFSTGILIIISGVGFENSRQTAEYIQAHIKPNYVVNIGSCAGRYNLHSWVQFFDTQLPFPWHDSLNRHFSTSLYSSLVPLSSIPNNYDYVDMESFAQRAIFAKSTISYYCLKFVTDCGSPCDYISSLPRLRFQFRRLLSFISDAVFDSNFSVVIPSYNRKSFTQAAVLSVLNQTKLPKEIIVVDDGSAVPLSPGDFDCNTRVRIIRNSCNQGVAHSRNIGVLSVKTNWICLLDSDDLWHKNHCAELCRELNKYPHYRWFQMDEFWYRNTMLVTPQKHLLKRSGWIFNDSLQRVTVSSSSVVFHRSIVEKVGLYEASFQVCEDYDIWLRFSLFFPIGLSSTKTVSKFSGHDDQLSKKIIPFDLFRIEALWRLLRFVKHKNQIRVALKFKSMVLYSGYKKRQNINLLFKILK